MRAGAKGCEQVRTGAEAAPFRTREHPSAPHLVPSWDVDVFLIPIDAESHELYCEVAEEDPAGSDPDHDRGFFRGLVRKFRDTLNHLAHLARGTTLATDYGKKSDPEPCDEPSHVV